MSIRLRCRRCGRTTTSSFGAYDTAAGRRMLCAGCGNYSVVPKWPRLQVVEHHPKGPNPWAWGCALCLALFGVYVLVHFFVVSQMGPFRYLLHQVFD